MNISCISWEIIVLRVLVHIGSGTVRVHLLNEAAHISEGAVNIFSARDLLLPKLCLPLDESAVMPLNLTASNC